MKIIQFIGRKSKLSTQYYTLSLHQSNYLLASISSKYARHIIRTNIGSAFFVKQFRNKRQSTQEVDQNVHILQFLGLRRKYKTCN